MRISDWSSDVVLFRSNAYDGRLESGVDPVEIRHELGALTPICPPGTCHSYQNVAYDTIAEIIARATRHSYADMVRTQLFEPLHMTGASIGMRSEEHTSELQSLLRILYAVFCLK